MKIYTRKGDDGNTSLAGGKKVPKYHPRIEANGSIDELISWMGLLRDFSENESRRQIIICIQNQLMKYISFLAYEKSDGKQTVDISDTKCISLLETEIDKMEKNLPSMKNFILPGGHILVSYCHIARCVCRRAERAVVKLNSIEKVPDMVCKFLNRLSDYLFVLSRQISLELDIKEINESF